MHWSGWPKVGGALTTIAALGALYFTNESLRATDNQYGLSQQTAVTDRFRLAAEQLASDKINVRLSGIYLLERLAKDSPDDHPTVFAVIAAFVRTQAPATDCPTPPVARPVDVEAALTVIGRRNTAHESSTHKLDLHDTCLTNANLRDARLSGAELNGADLRGANLDGAILDGAEASNAHFDDASLIGAFLRKTNLDYSTLIHADLTRATLSDASLALANLTKAQLTQADLRHAYLIRAILNGASLQSTDLTDADLGTRNLAAADLTDVLSDDYTRWPDYRFVPPHPPPGVIPIPR